MSDTKATLSIDGMDEPIDLPVYSGTIGPDVVDVGGLTAKGMFTYDPGFVSTAACESQITYIDGGQGVLLHRGYPIDQLAEKSDYLETCYLLLYGELPNAEQKKEFVDTVHNHTMVHEQIRTFFNGFRRDAHPMAIMCGVVGALSAFYHDSLDIADEHHRQVAAFRLIAKMPTIAAMCYKFSVGQPFMYPDNTMNYSENFLHMMFGNPCEHSKVSPVLARARRADVRDQAATLLDHHRRGEATGGVRRAGPHVDHVVPVRERHFPEGPPARQLVGNDERVVHQDIQPPLLLRHTVEERVDGIVVPMIAGDRDATTADRIDLRRDRFHRPRFGRRRVRRAARRAVDGRAARAETDRAAASDAPARAGDDRDTAFQRAIDRLGRAQAAASFAMTSRAFSSTRVPSKKSGFTLV